MVFWRSAGYSFAGTWRQKRTSCCFRGRWKGEWLRVRRSVPWAATVDVVWKSSEVGQNSVGCWGEYTIIWGNISPDCPAGTHRRTRQTRPAAPTDGQQRPLATGHCRWWGSGDRCLYNIGRFTVPAARGLIDILWKRNINGLWHGDNINMVSKFCDLTRYTLLKLFKNLPEPKLSSAYIIDLFYCYKLTFFITYLVSIISLGGRINDVYTDHRLDKSIL